MEVVGVLSLFALFFGGIMFFLIRRVWKRYCVIAIAIPTAGDPQAFRYKLTEAIRSLGFRRQTEAGLKAVFHAPAWQKWAVGLQDILVEPSDNGGAQVTGPAFNVAIVGRSFSGAVVRPYQGPQPVWPLIKGMLRMVLAALILFAASLLAAYLFGAGPQ
jgi:hypothetical protein